MSDDKLKVSDPKAGGIKPDEGNVKPATSMTVEIDGQQKTFTVDDAKNLIAQGAAATQKTQEVAALSDLAAKHNMSVLEFAKNYDGLMGKYAEYMDKGLIDENGDPIEQKKIDQVLPSDPPDFGNLPSSQANSDAKLEQVVQAALKSIVGDRLDVVEAGHKKMQENSALIMQSYIEGGIREKNSDLSEQDAMYIVNKAQGDTSKTIDEHIAEFKNTKKDYDVSQEEKYAKHFGIDLPTFNENRLHEQDAKGGGLAGLFKGIKFSFNKKGEGFVDPRKALEEHLKANTGG